MLKLLFVVLSLTVLGAQAQTSGSRPLSAPSSKDVAYVSQEVLLSGDTTTSVSVAPLTTSNSGFGLSRLATKFPGSPFGAMPIMPIPNPTTQTVALEEAARWVNNDLPPFRNRYGGWLKQKGLSMGFFNYTQEIVVTTPVGPKKKAVAFNATFDLNGRPTFGNAKIVDPDPTIVEAMYIPLATAAGLPPSWKYPDAGNIKWRLLNKKYEPLTGWYTEATGGAFDTPESDSTSDQAVKCLMDLRHPGCTGPVDIRALMDRAGASFAIVNHIRSLSPVYEEDGSDEQVPKAAISVDERTWNCDTFTNKGAFGFVLALMADQYLAEPSTQLVKFQLLQQYGGKGISPTEPYEKSVPVTDLRGQHPDSLIINPMPGDNTLWPRTDSKLMANVIYVAPVVAKGGSGEIGDATFAGDMAVRLMPSVGQNREYYIGTVGDNYWGTGSYDRTVRFDLVSPETSELFSIIQAGFDDHLLVSVNGTTVYIGASGGNMLEWVTGTEEQSCVPSEGGYACTGPSATWVSEPQRQRWGGGYTCGAGSVLSSGANGYGCYAVAQRNYRFCQADSWFGDSSERSSYSCTQGCAPYMVQHLTTGIGYGSGCLPLERRTSWNISTDIDLRPYLKSGTNEIFMRTIVGGGGEGWIRVRTRSCGASLNLDTSAPPAPPGTGVLGVLDRLRGQVKR